MSMERTVTNRTICRKKSDSRHTMAKKQNSWKQNETHWTTRLNLLILALFAFAIFASTRLSPFILYQLSLQIKAKKRIWGNNYSAERGTDIHKKERKFEGKKANAFTCTAGTKVKKPANKTVISVRRFFTIYQPSLLSPAKWKNKLKLWMTDKHTHTHKAIT